MKGWQSICDSTGQVSIARQVASQSLPSGNPFARLTTVKKSPQETGIGSHKSYCKIYLSVPNICVSLSTEFQELLNYFWEIMFPKKNSYNTDTCITKDFDSPCVKA